MLFTACADRGTPVVVTMAGGYAADVGETVQAYVGTGEGVTAEMGGV
jgi:hypothetical protein